MKIIILPGTKFLYFLSEKEALELGYAYDNLINVPDEELERWTAATSIEEKQAVQEQMKKYLETFLQSNS